MDNKTYAEMMSLQREHAAQNPFEPYAGMHKGLPIKIAVPKWCCPYCCEPVGYMGNWLAAIFGVGFHGCTFENVRTTPELRAWIRRG